MSSESFNYAGIMPNGPHIYDEIPAFIWTELNAYSDRDLIIRMRHLARKKRMRRPDITDEEMADYLALAENFQNFAHWMSARRSELQTPVRALAGWATVLAIAAGLLTATLIASIAITV